MIDRATAQTRLRNLVRTAPSLPQPIALFNIPIDRYDGAYLVLGFVDEINLAFNLRHLQTRQRSLDKEPLDLLAGLSGECRIGEHTVLQFQQIPPSRISSRAGFRDT